MTTASNTARRATESATPDIPDVVGISKAVGDQLRANILKVLAQDSFAVLELGEIFEVAQPAMSHHLKKLAEAGLVNKRRDGTSLFYQRTSPHATTQPKTAPLLRALFTAIDQQPLAAHFHDRIRQIHQARVARSQHFFAHQADALSNQGTLICEPSVYLDHVIEIVTTYPGHKSNRALEVGPGGGTLLRALAAAFDAVVGVDNSAEVLSTTREATAGLGNVTLLQADFAELPQNHNYDLIVAAMVIHHLPSPLGFFQQAARLLNANGLLVVAELCDHNQDWVRQRCGDVWLGFSPEQLTHWSREAGFALQHQQFLAQRNGFRVQVSAFAPATDFNSNPHLNLKT